jgi:hypothetical protein
MVQGELGDAQEIGQQNSLYGAGRAYEPLSESGR